MSDLATEMVVPDVLGSFTGYRAWRWDSLSKRLISFGYGDWPWQPGLNEAECSRQHLWMPDAPLQERTVPHEGCTCGFHSLASAEQAIEHFYGGDGRGGNSQIAGAVKLTGKVIPGVDHAGYGVGFKSQHAEIIELWKPERMTNETAFEIERVYGVPVRGIPDEIRGKLWNQAVEKQIAHCTSCLNRRAASARADMQKQLIDARIKLVVGSAKKMTKWDVLRGYIWALAYVRGARNGSDRPLCNNTRVCLRPNDHVAVKLHATDVVTYTPRGIILRTGNWYTVTTKGRINMALRACTDYQCSSSGHYGKWTLIHSDTYLGYGDEQRTPFGTYEECWKQAHDRLGCQQVALFDHSGYMTMECPKGYKEHGYLSRDSTKLERKVARMATRLYNAKRKAWIEANRLEVAFEDGILVPYKGGRI